MTEDQKIDIYGFNIDVTDDDVNEKDVLPIILVRLLLLFSFLKNEMQHFQEFDMWKKCLKWTTTFKELKEVLCNIQMIQLQMLFFIIMELLVKQQKNSSFLHSVNQRKLAMHITLKFLADNLLVHVDFCGRGHSLENI